MKKILSILSLIVLCSCSSVKYFNSKLGKQIPEQQLKSDVDYVYMNLKKLHPSLYWYISKKDLDNKFDSLKVSITKPMTNREFYEKLSPVVSSIRQGHAFVYPPNKMLTRKEKEFCINYGTTPLSKFEFEMFDDRLYIVKNNSIDTSLVVGTEVLKVNDTKPADLLLKYKNNFASDGFNQTFKALRLSKGFPAFYYFENDTLDILKCQVKSCDSLRTVYFVRKPDNILIKKVPASSSDRKTQRKEATKNKYLGYDRSTKKYSKNLSFYEPDSSIAVMKLNNFSKGQSKKFFHDSFEKLAKLKARTLIIDLRDNPGGKLREINELYSYLVDSDFYFIDKEAVVSKTSLLHVGYFNGIPLGKKIARATLYPLFAGVMVVPFLKVRKGEDGKYYYFNLLSKMQHPKPNNFKGKIYVLINGGSFSASCILSSNLKGAKRATFIGSETGGAFNGTVAGALPVYSLPNSRLRVRFGLMVVQPHYKTDIEGHGIYPDVEIVPTLNDRIKGIDPELNWALQNAKIQN